MKKTYIHTAIALACFLFFYSCSKAKNFEGEWSTYIPSEYGFTYVLFENGSCELKYDSAESQWAAKECSWINEANKIVVTLKDEKVKMTVFNEQEETTTTNAEEEKYFSLKGYRIKYSLDENYINEHLKQLYNCKNDINIEGVLAIKPVENTGCQEEWCTQPYFKINKGSGHKSLQEIKYPCRQ